MRLTVTPRDPDRRDELAATIASLQTVDVSLRKSLSGSDPSAVVEEARRSFSSAGVEMSDEDLHAYAQSVADRTDFEYVLD